MHIILNNHMLISDNMSFDNVQCGSMIVCYPCYQVAAI